MTAELQAAKAHPIMPPKHGDVAHLLALFQPFEMRSLVVDLLTKRYFNRLISRWNRWDGKQG